MFVRCHRRGLRSLGVAGKVAHRKSGLWSREVQHSGRVGVDKGGQEGERRSVASEQGVIEPGKTDDMVAKGCHKARGSQQSLSG